MPPIHTLSPHSLSGKGKLLLWDLLQNDQQPSQRVEVGDSATVAVSNMIDPYGPSYLALQSGADAGAVQIHTLKSVASSFICFFINWFCWLHVSGR